MRSREPMTSLQAVQPAAVHCTLYHRNPGFIEIAEAELRTLGGGFAPESGIWLSDVPIAWATCGYAKAAGRQLAAAKTLEGLESDIRALNLSVATFNVETVSLPRRRSGSTDAKVRISDCIDGDVSMDEPQVRFLLVISPLGYRLLLRSDTAPNAASWLEASHKPHNSMVGTPVRMAQALLNLTMRSGDTMLDPFCGSGTFPLLAAWAGHQAFGSDISSASVDRARENVGHFGLEATLTCEDARTTQQVAHCIVSNLPYGVYCHLQPGAMREILGNLGRLSPRLTFVTSERIDDLLDEAGYEILQRILVEPNRFRRLVYVTRGPLAETSPAT